MGTCQQARVQAATVPAVTSTVQALLSSQVLAHAPSTPAVMARSQASPGSTTPLPQRGAQSLSVRLVHPSGQQPSSSRQLLDTLATQRALQVLGDPASVNIWQPFEGGQARAQASGLAPKSQLSAGDSTMPLPHTGAQSGSTPKWPPGGQQASPGAKTVMGMKTHIAWQVPAPTR